ncbi:hypothetical protein Thimo_1407 [Thioflavicoccus mobilis 8321]|uniref:Metal-dependent peptidase n=1 Tax=Thioflavicoccus mobilis 8321 TaxID=765912 RepID=L0GW32_9GAMM|nr:VWA-like domain-containing protein [Thioflavicoccus mobilis]AGA90201.1 hypothetical protein Thimo_1407 [Thioflavicoccus mobilis 8321]
MSAEPHRGSRAIRRMIEVAPSTGGLALWIRHRDVANDRDAPPIATDGTTIYYGPAFEALSLPAQIGLIAHEVLHVALRHPQRGQVLAGLLDDLDPVLYNLCADALVNSTLSHLTWVELPDKAIHLDQLLANSLGIHQPLERSLLEWDLERLYRAIDDRHLAKPTRLAGTANRRGTNGSGDGPDQPRTEDHPAERIDGPRAARARLLGHASIRDLLPADAGDRPQDEAERSRDWRERLVRAHANDGAHSMLRTLVADLPRLRTPWEQVLRTRLTRGLSRRRELSWSRPARSYLANHGRLGGKRMPWEPGQSATKAVPRLALIVDVSGSIEAGLLARFAGEIEAITRRLETRIVVVIGDRQVSRVEIFEPGRSNLREITFQGGGGTDFSPLLQEADAYRPDLGVVLTDLAGPAGFRPAWPVLWAVPAACAGAEAPFGTKLILQ